LKTACFLVVQGCRLKHLACNLLSGTMRRIFYKHLKTKNEFIRIRLMRSKLLPLLTLISFCIMFTLLAACNTGEHVGTPGNIDQIIEREDSPTNTAPQVDAGEDLIIYLPTDQIRLSPGVTDDGLPEDSTLDYYWTQQSGPGIVTFDDSNILDATATFDSAGSYILQLSVDDGELSSSDTIAIAVNAADIGETSDYHSDDFGDLVFDDGVSASSMEDEIADRLASENSVKITFPAGTFLLEETVDFELEDGQSIIFEGAGINETFFVNGSSVQFRQSGPGGDYVRFTRISFISDPVGDTVKAIQLRSPGDFRIDHCYFNGRWHGMIDIIRSGSDIGTFIQKGLIDHIEAVNSKDSQGYYGIQIAPKYQPSDMDDETFWSTYWNEHFNTVLGTENSVFVEDSTFTNFHTSVITNWASFGKITVRHNTFYSHDGYTQVGFKSGSYYSECYNNTFINTTADGQETVLPDGRAMTMRTGGVLYNNTFQNLQTSAFIYNYKSGFGYTYPSYTWIDDLYVWDNTYENCGYDSDTIGDNSGYAWSIRDSEGNAGDFVNAGDEVINDVLDGYSPYQYPHPNSLK
jgi:hypothetical protein